MVGPGQNKGESPHGLDRGSEHQAAKDTLDSLFHIEVVLKQGRKEEDGEPVACKVYTTFSEKVTELEQERGIVLSPDAITAGTVERYASGFAIAAGQGAELRILTCAHTLEDVFTEGYHDVTVKQVNQMFRFNVHCTHHEAGILKKISRLKPSERARDPTPAVAVAIDTRLDLLVLEVDDQDLSGENRVTCNCKHPVIQLAKSNPTELQKLILLGCPPQRSKALAVGQVSLNDWSYDGITSLNVKGYTMDVLEVPGMAASIGFSGGPIIDGNSQCAAVYHGVFNGVTGYGVSLHNVQEFLDKHKMFSFEDEDSDDEDSDFEKSAKRKVPVKKRGTPVKKRGTPVKKQGTPVKKQVTW